MRNTRTLVSIFAVLTLAGTAHGGGVLETIDITGRIPSPIPGHFVARVIGIKWDTRTLPVRYSMNSTLNPIPNPLGTAFLSLADATAAMQTSLDAWNQIPTSFIDMQVTGNVANLGVRRFDMINEITFRTAGNFGAIASSPSVSLIADTTLPNGRDLDGDGDSDVSSAISVAGDVDGDGDIEFPAGFYKAGTILENDVQFNTKTSGGFRFTADPAAADTVTRSVDLIGVAVHEFGHSHGLSHTLNNQSNAADGNGATMFPFIDTGDPAAELAQRTLDSDDIAWSSFLYPEGSAPSGPAALQAGDVAFDEAFGLIRGSVTHGVLNQPIAGASVWAADRQTETLIATGFSGTTRVSFNPVNGGLFLINPAFNIIDGAYVIPVPKGSYQVGVEPVDGSPVSALSISLTTQIGVAFGQQNFNEELFNRNKEGALEKRPGQEKNVHVNPGETEDVVDITTNSTFNVNNFGDRNAIGFINPPSGIPPVPAGRIYAVRIPASQISAVNPGQDILIHSMTFDTFVLDASVAPVFASATLTTCKVDAAGNIVSVELSEPLEGTTGFLGQDNDFAPFHFKNPHELGKRVRRGIADGEIENLLLMLRLPLATPYAGVSAQPPAIGLDGPTPSVPVNDAPLFGLSYRSDNAGQSFVKIPTFNFRFSLILAEPTP